MYVLYSPVSSCTLPFRDGIGWIEMKPRDLTGQRFGRLTALSRLEGNGMSRWLCSCDCGRMREVFTTNLVNGRTRACGCIRRTSERENTMQEVLNANGMRTVSDGV